MTTARHFRCQQWVPGVSENPVHSFSTRAQEMQQHENNRRIANHKCDFERKNRLVNRCYRSEEELRARRIWTWYIRVVQRARFGRICVERNSRIARRYATPATASGTRKDGAPRLLNVREQIVSVTSMIAPSPYSLCEGESFTALPNTDAGARLLVPTRRTMPQFSAPLPERAAVREPTESNRLGCRCRRRVL